MSKWLYWSQTVLASALVVAACGPSVAPADLAEPPPDMADPGYPPAPYGNVKDAVPPNFTFQGYYAATRTTGLSSSEPHGEVTFDMLRKSGQRYALIELAAYW